MNVSSNYLRYVYLITENFAMKKLATVLFLGASFWMYGQEDYVILLNGDSISGKVSIDQDQYLEKVVIKNNGKETFKHFQVREVYKDGEFYDPISYEQKRLFGKRIAKGTLSLYLIRTGNSYDYNQDILLKGEKEYLMIPNISFRSAVSEFLFECKKLSEDIENKVLTKKDLLEIVQQYNQCAIDTKPDGPTPRPTSRLTLQELSILLKDIEKKQTEGKPIPNYLIKALEEYKAENLSELIDDFLNDN